MCCSFCCFFVRSVTEGAQTTAHRIPTRFLRRVEVVWMGGGECGLGGALLLARGASGRAVLSDVGVSVGGLIYGAE